MKLRKIKVFYSVVLAAAISICMQTTTSACTAVYVGKDVSENGTTMIARTVEWAPGYMTYVDSCDAKEHEKGDYFEDPMSGFKYEYPDKTYKYVISSTMEFAGEGKTTDVCSNEYGLAISATVTAYANEKALQADPYVEDGISEGSISLVLGSSCKNAREAVELLCDIVDKYGSADSNIVYIADQEEAWYVELYTGHQYAAVKMPEDKASVVCNQFMLRSFDINDKDVYYSKDIIDLAIKNKFAVFVENGCINLYETYANGVNRYVYPRLWKGQKLLAPSKSSEYNPDEEYKLFFEPDNKVSFADIAEVFRTEYDEDDEFNLENGAYINPISQTATDSMHIIEISDKLPAEMSNVLWLRNSPSMYGQFVPISNIVDEIPESYSTNLSESEYVEGVAACEFSRLNVICILNPDYIGAKIASYNIGIEKSNKYAFDKHMEEWEQEYKKNPSKVKESITKYCADIMEESTKDAQRLFNEICWYLPKQYYPFYYIDDKSAVKRDFAPIETFELCFDVEKLLDKYDWTIERNDQKLTARKDGRTITIILDEVETYINNQINWQTGEVLVTEEEKKNQKKEGRLEYLNNILISNDNSDEVERYATYVNNEDGKIMIFVNMFHIFEE